jgi:hypothetical protein
MEVMPVDLVALTAIVLGCLMFLIPIAGFTLRYAIKPISEALAKRTDGSADRESIRMLERRMALLEQEMHGIGEMRGDLSRLLEELDFQKQLTRPEK